MPRRPSCAGDNHIRSRVAPLAAAAACLADEVVACVSPATGTIAGHTQVRSQTFTGGALISTTAPDDEAHRYNMHRMTREGHEVASILAASPAGRT